MTRFSLFLSCAYLTLFFAKVMPKRGLSEVLNLANKVIWDDTDGIALLKTYSKWVGVSSLSSLEKLFSPTLDNYADKRARPLARRLAITLRPFLVAIRARKPCERLRFKLLG